MHADISTGSSARARFAAIAFVAIAAACIATPAAAQSSEPLLYISVGETSRPPIGWVQFCQDRPWECRVEATEARDVDLTNDAYRELARVNRHVNERIRPMTDLEQYGMVEKWTYPESGYGDCEDYVLLKRRILMQLGWPRSALLVTVVRDKKGDGHSVLTVRTNRGELVLDNQVDEILPWAETGYRYTKRQSQHDPNLWVSLGDPRPTPFVSAR
ncbi:MAG: transglutaminase-like cysteine peptidase [Bradyrhizobiaceae bacterium]|nr:transglutaminase-like cysteine peptidase [Bradyrhizobiaceae bacterium]